MFSSSEIPFYPQGLCSVTVSGQRVFGKLSDRRRMSAVSLVDFDALEASR